MVTQPDDLQARVIRTPPDACGVLTLVGTPIGNPDDFSARGIQTLRNADLIACEEFKEARRLLRRHSIDVPLLEINEHTETADASDVIDALMEGKNVALISDCGMPIFADPGSRLVELALASGLCVNTVPGPTSLTTALVLSGFDITRFYFYGFLSPKRPERVAELRTLKSHPSLLVFLDAPYRLNQLLADLAEVFGTERRACVACDLTLDTEHVERGTIAAVRKYFMAHPEKREFVVLLESARRRSR